MTREEAYEIYLSCYLRRTRKFFDHVKDEHLDDFSIAAAMDEVDGLIALGVLKIDDDSLSHISHVRDCNQEGDCLADK